MTINDNLFDADMNTKYQEYDKLLGAENIHPRQYVKVGHLLNIQAHNRFFKAWRKVVR